jgi:hypothetical protein
MARVEVVLPVPDAVEFESEGTMSDLRKITDRFSLSDGIAAGVIFIVAAFVVAIGFDFDVAETLEVLVTGVLLVAVLGIAAAIPWAVGSLVDLLTDDDSR